MADDKTVGDLTAADTLTGTELVHVVQGGNSRQSTAQDIADLFGTVQSSPTDNTADRLLKVGASATVLSASPALRATYGGTADAITLTTGASLGSIPTGLLVRFRATNANTGSVTINVDGIGTVSAKTITGGSLPAGYIRTDVDTIAVYDGTSWILDRQIERGSNANGEYVRFADGTQFCTKTITGLGPIDTASGALFTNSGGTFVGNLPASFVTGPIRICQAYDPTSAGHVIVAGAGIPTTGNGGKVFLFRSTTSSSTDYVLQCTFIGRWF